MIVWTIGHPNLLEYILATIKGFIMGCLINFILMILIFFMINIHASKKEVIDTTVFIKAIKDNQSINGNFFLGSGNINGEIYYYYMTCKDDNTQIKKIKNNDNVYMIENNIEKPKIIFYKKEFVNPKLKDMPCLGTGKIKIYIPKGTLKMNYNIDME
ncbi:hypothetical protein [Clostridium botulinum]|uniref:hypothetical protein n=2 Tax=Clostridium botulinum TaxID=1491 RepID=UPI000B154E36|nr:hypothetical protein [Clostridium botulinum]NFH75761.1 hypothetical protein [Clostridium botulinum]